MQFEKLRSLAAQSVAQGIRHAVISPGSRSAAIAVAFARQPDFKIQVVNDERSAAYIALGMAQSLNQPVVLICTSGTAAVNYGPAVTEAFFLHVPLIVLTADRPPEYLGRGDGQMIFQQNLYGRHVKYFVQLPVYDPQADHKTIQADFTLAVVTAREPQPGPVHVNIPIAEPFYPELIRSEKGKSFSVPVLKKSSQAPDSKQWLERLASYSKILVVVTQNQRNEALQNALSQLGNVPVILESTSNIDQGGSRLGLPDILFRHYRRESYPDLKPDLLITVGENVISRPLKTVIRNWKGFDHWHLQPAGKPADVFFSHPQQVPVAADHFFTMAKGKFPVIPEAYYARWKTAHREARERLERVENSVTRLNEYSATRGLLDHLGKDSVLHLGNSMPIRWANLCRIPDGITVYSNRGTSGIDGVLSTALGHSLADARLHYVLLGDVSFFYDRNAFWLKEHPGNLRVIVLNNQGGGIFSLIDGPSQLPEFQELFLTYQTGKVKSLADEFNISYRSLDHLSDLDEAMRWVTAREDGCRILEVVVSLQENQRIYQNMMEMD